MVAVGAPEVGQGWEAWGDAGRRRRKRMRKSSSLGGILPPGKWGCMVGVASHKNLIPTEDPTLLVILGYPYLFHGLCARTSGSWLTAQEPLLPTKPASKSRIFGAKLKLVTRICPQG